MKLISQRCQLALLIGAILILTIGLVSCGSDDDESSNPIILTVADPSVRQITALPTTTIWHGIVCVNGTDIYLTSDRGLIYRGIGGVWEELKVSQTDQALNSAWGWGGDTVYIVGSTVIRDINNVFSHYQSLILRYNGTIFPNEIDANQWNDRLLDIWGDSDSLMYAVGEGGRVVRFKNGSWTSVGGGGNVILLSIWGSVADDIYACGNGGAILHLDSTDGIWSAVTSRTQADFWDVFGFGDSSVFFAGSGGHILHRAGSVLTTMTTPTTNLLYSLWGATEDQMYATGTDGTIIRYNGSSWTSMTSPTQFDLRGVVGDASGRVYAAGHTLLELVGGTWEPIDIGNVPHFNDVWSGSATESIMVGSRGEILKSVGGDVWSRHTTETDTILHGVWGAPDGSVRYAVGENGTILQQTSLSATDWTTKTSGISTDLLAVSGFTDTEVIAVGAGGMILQGDGEIWTSVTSGTGETLNDVWTDDDAVAFAVGDGGTILRRLSGTWTTMTNSDTENLNGIFGFSATDIYAVGDNGTVLHYNGSAWQVMTSGVTTRLNSVWGTSSTDLFVCGEAGLLRHYDGTSWTTITTGVGVDLNGLYGTTADDFHVAGSFNHLLHYAK